MRRLFLLMAILLSPAMCWAQNTSVTATVTDQNGTPYAGATGYAALVCPGNQAPTYNGYTVPRTFAITGLDGNGTFTQVVYDVSVLQPTGCGYQWHITSKDGTSFITGIITSVTGSAVNESTSISAYAVPLPGSTFPGGPIPAQPYYFFDPFARTAGSLGANYTDVLNGFSSSSSGGGIGTAVGTAGGDYNITAFTAVAAAPTESATVTVSGSGISGGWTGLGLRAKWTTPQTTANFYEFVENSTTLFLRKATNADPSNGGTNTVLLQVSATTSTSDDLTAKIVGNTIFAAWNCTAATMEYNDSNSPFATGQPALDMDGSGLGATIGNFTVKNSVPAPGALRQLIVDGDSTSYNAAICSNPYENNTFPPGFIAPISWSDYLVFPKNRNVSVTNIAIPGKGLGTARPASGVNGGGSAGTIETMIQTASSVIVPLLVPALHPVCTLGPLVNDIANGTSAAQEYAYLTQYISTLHAGGCKVIVTPSLSCMSNDSVMQAFNVLMFANAAGADAVASLPQSLIGVGAYANTAYFTDGTHLTKYASTQILAPAESNALAPFF